MRIVKTFCHYSENFLSSDFNRSDDKKDYKILARKEARSRAKGAELSRRSAFRLRGFELSHEGSETL